MEFTDHFVELFWQKVDIRGDNECWPWKAHLNEDGYGQVRFDGNMKIASRVAYMITNGEIPSDIKAMHTCDTRNCCNPKHLIAGTQGDNIRDMENKNRSKHRGWDVKRFSEEEILKVREMWKNGFQAKDIADKYGVTPDTIYKIRMGRTYKNIGGFIDSYTARGKSRI